MAAKICKNCGMLKKDCVCSSKRDEIVRCSRCSFMRRSKYMKRFGEEEICSNCLTAQHIPGQDIEYYRTLANKYSLKLYDIGIHIRAANKLGAIIEEYLAELPRTLNQYREYFRGTTMEEVAEAAIEKPETVVADAEAVIWPGYK